MKKVIDTEYYDIFWLEKFKDLFELKEVPRYVIIEFVEE